LIADLFIMKYTWIVFLLLLGACCYKRGCVCPENTLSINIDSALAGADDFYLMVYQKGTTTHPIDSLSLPVAYPCTGCPKDHRLVLNYALAGNREMKNYAYILKNQTQTVADTINAIYYDYYSNTYTCNKCITGDDIQTCNVPINFSVTFNMKTYQGNHPDSLVIR
jgi:hypothetical protein